MCGSLYSNGIIQNFAGNCLKSHVVFWFINPSNVRLIFRLYIDLYSTLKIFNVCVFRFVHTFILSFIVFVLLLCCDYYELCKAVKEFLILFLLQL